MPYYERTFRDRNKKTVYKKLERYPTSEVGRWRQNRELDLQDKRIESISYKSKPTKSKLNRVVTNYTVAYKDGNKSSVRLLSNSNKLPKKFEKYKNIYSNAENDKKSKYLDRWYKK